MMYGLTSLDEATSKELFLPKDSSGREVNIFKIKDCLLTGKSLFYPNIAIYATSEDKIFNPIRERVMSLQKDTTTTEVVFNRDKKIQYQENYPVFFFCYNVDNYFHFIYDTLPYLITYRHLKLRHPNLKLLMNFSSAEKNVFYKFVLEFLDLLGITQQDILIADENTLYETIYVSSSYTHDIDSNLPPREEVYSFLQNIAKKAATEMDSSKMPENIYVSRRTWVHNDLSNIGTNYTTRRKMINEDELVKVLAKRGYTEVFTENLSTVEKLCLFYKAKNIIGPIGGGLCNVLFSTKECNLTAIVSPHFLDINKRFIYSFCGVNTNLCYETEHQEKGDLKLYMRVKAGNKTGEIVKIEEDNITISYAEIPVAGWNSSALYKNIVVKAHDCMKLDEGLNSCFKVHMDGFLKTISK